MKIAKTGFIIGLLMAAFFAASVHAQQMFVRVGLVRSLSPAASIHISNTSLQVGAGHELGFLYITTLHSPGGFTVRMDAGRVTISGGGGHVFDAGQAAQVMAPGGGFVEIGGYSYRGAIEFLPTGSQITLVNVICMEEYLYGVVPNEMWHTFHIEALRAQAVAARTFAYNAVIGARHGTAGFSLCDNTHCQMYRGIGREQVNTTQAVRDTHGLMLFYNNRTILASYFSSSGGATENSEDVWHEARPYLRGVVDPFEHEPLVWERNFTWAQLTQLANTAGANIGTVQSVEKTLSDVGRVIGLTFVGSNGRHSVVRDAVRTFFSPIGGALQSRNFTITAGGAAAGGAAIFVTDGEATAQTSPGQAYVVDEVGALRRIGTADAYDGHVVRSLQAAPAALTGGNGIHIQGAGWGHGVGMSQRGAYGMARMGFDFIEILTHYYTGVQVRTR